MMKPKTIFTMLMIFCLTVLNAQESDYRLLKKSFKSPVTAVEVSPDGSWILAGLEDGTFLRLSPVDLSEDLVIESAASAAIYDIEMSPKMDVIFLAAGSRISLYDTAGAHIINWPHHKNTMWSMDLDPSGKYLVSTEVNKTFQLTNVYEGRIEQAMRAHTDIVLAVAFSPDGKWIASGSNDKTILLWDSETREVVKSFQGISENIYDVTFSPDGKLLAAASRDKKIRIWDIENDKMLHLLQGHQDMVFEIAFSPCGKYLISASFDQSIKLWDLAKGEQIYAYLENTSSVPDLCFLPDGKSFVGACMDGVLSVWELHPEIFVVKYFGKEYKQEMKDNPIFLPKQKGEKKADYQQRMAKAEEIKHGLIAKYYEMYLEL